MNDFLVTAFGNPMMGDEGIGLRILEKLIATQGRFPGVDFLDLGTSGARLLHALAGRKKVIILDCALMGRRSGEMVRFTPEEVASKAPQARLSLHEGNVLEVIALAKQLGECPDEIVIFGIEPERVELGKGLSPTLSRQLDTYANEITVEIQK